MSAADLKSEGLPQRLCSEIQLFDLCDLDTCSSRNNRFCTNPDMLVRFEEISDVELRPPERFTSEELDEDGDADGFDDDDDEFSMNDFEGEEDDGWEN